MFSICWWQKCMYFRIRCLPRRQISRISAICNQVVCRLFSVSWVSWTTSTVNRSCSSGRKSSSRSPEYDSCFCSNRLTFFFVCRTVVKTPNGRCHDRTRLPCYYVVLRASTTQTTLALHVAPWATLGEPKARRGLRQTTWEVLLLKNTWNDENEISKPKMKRISRLLRSSSKCCGNQEMRTTVPLTRGSDGFF